MLQNQPQYEHRASERQILSLLLDAFRDMPPAVVVASIIINFLGLVLPLAVMQVYDRIIPRQSDDTLATLMVIVVCVIVAESVLRIARCHVIGWAATKLAWSAYREMLSRLMTATDSSIAIESEGHRFERAHALVTYAEWHGSPSRLVLVDVPFIFLFIGLMIVIGGLLALVPICLFLSIGFAAFQSSEKLRQASGRRATEDLKVRDFLTEILSGIGMIKASAMEPQMMRRFERLQEGLADRSARMMRLADEAQAYGGLLSSVTQAATVTVGAVFVIYGLLSVGTLACCVMLSGRAVQPLLRFVAVWNELQSVMVGLEKAAPILDLPASADSKTTALIDGPWAIDLDSVTLRHHIGGVALLDAQSLHVPAGSILAIMGQDGSGKSTIAEMFCGHRDIDSGVLTIGGVRVPDQSAGLKASTNLVRPDSSTIRGTILDNITMFRQGQDIAFAKEAARLIGLDADILRLPLGYETPIVDGVIAELPPGFVQRIAIARAIARRPSLLVLDEANSSLDIRADQHLAEGLKALRGHTTIVIITNRPSFAQIADQIFVLQGGKLNPERLRTAASNAA